MREDGQCKVEYGDVQREHAVLRVPEPCRIEEKDHRPSAAGRSDGIRALVVQSETAKTFFDILIRNKSPVRSGDRQWSD